MSKDIGGVLGISRGLLRNRNVRTLALTSLISGAYIGMLNSLLQPFTIGLGLGIAALGILQALGNRFSGLASSIAQPIAGHYADLFGRKVVVLAGSATAVAAMGLFLVAALSRSPAALAVAFVLYGLSMLSSPASQAMLAESVGMEPGVMDVAFSTLFLLGTISGTMMSFLAGPLVGVAGYVTLFAFAAALEVGDFILYASQLTETWVQGHSGAESFSLRNALAIPKGFRGFFATLAMDSVAFSVIFTIIYGMLVDRFGFSLNVISLLVGVSSLSTILAQYPATRLLLRFGPIKSMVFSEVIACVMMVGWAVSSSVSVFLVVSVLFGVSVAAWVPAQQSLLMARSPPGGRGAIGGQLAVYRGVVAFPGPILGGFLYQSLGYEAPILAGLAITVLTVVMIVKLLPGPPATKV